MKNYIQYGLLLSLLVLGACGKNKSGAQQPTSSFSPININQPVAQSLAEIKNQIASKSAVDGLVVGQSYVFFRTTTTSTPGSFWIFDYNTFSSSTDCDEVRPNAVSTVPVSIAVRAVNCSTGSSSASFETRSFNGHSSPAIQEILNIAEGTVQQVRSVTISYKGGSYQGYLIVTGSGIYGNVVTQYVVSPQLPLLLNPVLKANGMESDGVIGAQIQVL
ncbi:MAG: hypothetical protein LW878_07520 [Proteobacteria bacterium]|jgi:hypothetical protein|nr:hypothetical protein [Pseudomonadota bacterium]